MNPRAHASSRCAAMTVALVLAFAPVTGRAAVAQPTEPEPTEPEPTEPEPSWEEPVEIVPPEAPVPEPTEQPAAAPTQEERSVEAPQEVPAPEAGDATAEIPDAMQERARVNRLRERNAGIGLMASGGVVATTGLGLTIAYTILGDAEEAAEEPVLAEVERKADIAQAGGILLASGIAMAAIGGILLVQSRRKAQGRAAARLILTPALGGVVLTGRF